MSLNTVQPNRDPSKYTLAVPSPDYPAAGGISARLKRVLNRDTDSHSSPVNVYAFSGLEEITCSASVQRASCPSAHACACTFGEVCRVL